MENTSKNFLSDKKHFQKLESTKMESSSVKPKLFFGSRPNKLSNNQPPKAKRQRKWEKAVKKYINCFAPSRKLILPSGKVEPVRQQATQNKRQADNHRVNNKLPDQISSGGLNLSDSSDKEVQSIKSLSTKQLNNKSTSYKEVHQRTMGDPSHRIKPELLDKQKEKSDRLSVSSRNEGFDNVNLSEESSDDEDQIAKSSGSQRPVTKHHSHPNTRVNSKLVQIKPVNMENISNNHLSVGERFERQVSSQMEKSLLKHDISLDSQAKRLETSLSDVTEQSNKSFEKDLPATHEKHQMLGSELLEEDLYLSESSSDEESPTSASLPTLGYQKAEKKFPHKLLFNDLSVSENGNHEQKDTKTVTDVLRQMHAFDEAINKEEKEEPIFESFASRVRFIPKEDFISPIKDLIIPDEDQKTEELCSRQLVFDNCNLSEESNNEEVDSWESSLIELSKKNMISLIENLPTQPNSPKPGDNVSHQILVDDRNLPEIRNKEESPMLESVASLATFISKDNLNSSKKYFPIPEKHQTAEDNFPHQISFCNVNLLGGSIDEEEQAVKSPPAKRTKLNSVSLDKGKSSTVAKIAGMDKRERSVKVGSDDQIGAANRKTKAISLLNQLQVPNQASVSTNRKELTLKKEMCPISTEMVKKPKVSNQTESCPKKYSQSTKDYKPTVQKEERVKHSDSSKKTKKSSKNSKDSNGIQRTHKEYRKSSSEDKSKNASEHQQLNKCASKSTTKTVVKIPLESVANSSKVTELRTKTEMDFSKAKKRPRESSSSRSENKAKVIPSHSKHSKNIGSTKPLKMIVQIPLDSIANPSNTLKRRREEPKKLCLKLKKITSEAYKIIK